MLIRLIVKNILSFGMEKPFDLLPFPRYSRLNHHKYEVNDTSILKLSAIYGANGSGKSNLVKCLDALKFMAEEGELPYRQLKSFMLDPTLQDENQVMGIEYFQNGKFYLYEIEFKKNLIISETLYETINTQNQPEMIFERENIRDGNIEIKFFEGFENNQENATLKKVIEKTLAKPSKPILKLLAKLDNEDLARVRQAHTWFKESLDIVTPISRPQGLVIKLELDKKFKNFANESMNSFDTGVEKIVLEEKPLDEFFGEDERKDNVIEMLKENPNKILSLHNTKREEITAQFVNDEIIIKRIALEHKCTDNTSVRFNLDDISDGTNRLLDYLPAFHDVFNVPKVYVIDEIERSIHPLLIKELIKKFSNEKQSKGQIIFTTHESNLLDQEILRQDEIWFIEKDKCGCSDMYPLSEFKEHNTKDIRKGYLNGRYGAIPFLGNLKDLNWTNATSE